MSTKVSASAQAIQPTSPVEKGELQGPFVRFQPPKKEASSKSKNKEGKDAPKEEKPDLYLILGGKQVEKKHESLQDRAQFGASAAFLELLLSLKGHRELLLRFGIRVYQTLRGNRSRGKLKKGAILDEQA